MISLVMTVMAPDQPGLVEALAACLNRHGGNWQESRMAHLDGQFVGLLRVQLQPEQAPPLIASLAALEGVRVQVSEPSSQQQPTKETVLLEILGQDRVGIVKELSQVLSTHRVNVEELETTVENAPWSGEQLFRAKARLQVPPEQSMEELREKLQAIGSDLMVEVVLSRKV
ncbi:MAG: ACT domain-containing protein [Verrucomicrobiota bacterium]